MHTTMAAVAAILAADQRRREIILPAVSASLQRSNRRPTPLLVVQGVLPSQGGGGGSHGLCFVGVPCETVFIDDAEAVKGALTVLAKIYRQHADKDAAGLKVVERNRAVLEGLESVSNDNFDAWVAAKGDEYLNEEWLQEPDCRRMFDTLLGGHFEDQVAAARAFLVQEEVRALVAAEVAAAVAAAVAAPEAAVAAQEGQEGQKEQGEDEQQEGGGEDGHAESGEKSDGSNEDNEGGDKENEDGGGKGGEEEEEEESSGAQDLEAAKERVGRFLRSPLKEGLMQGLG